MATKKQNEAAERRIKHLDKLLDAEYARMNAERDRWMREAAEQKQAAAERAARGERDPLPEGGTWVQRKNGEWVISF